MILDKETILWKEAALSATGVSTNTLDRGATSQDTSKGEPLALGIAVGVDADFTTEDETYTFNIIESDAENLSNPRVISSRAIAAEELVAGSLHVIPIPPGSLTKRYLGASATLGGTTPSVTVTAWIAPLNFFNNWATLPDAIHISP